MSDGNRRGIHHSFARRSSSSSCFSSRFRFSFSLNLLLFLDSLSLYQPAEPAAPSPKAWATDPKPDVVVSTPAPAPAAPAAAVAKAPVAAAAASKAGRRLLAPGTKKAAGELRVDDPKIDEGVIAPAAAASSASTAEASGARNGFALRPPGSPDVSAAEVAAVAAASVAASAPSASASASASAANAAKPLLQARVNSALVARGNGDAAPLYEVRSGDTNAREPQAAADADVGLDYVRPGDSEGKTVLTSPNKKLEAEKAATTTTTATGTATAAASAPTTTKDAEPAAAAAAAPFDPLASTPGLQLSIPSSESGTAWSADKLNDNTITASFDASSPGYLVGGGSGDSGVAVCAGRGLALVAAGGAVSVFTAEGVRKAGPTPLSAFFKGVEKPTSSSSKDNKLLPTGSWSSARCVYDASSSTPEAERQFYLAALYSPAPSSAEDASFSSTSSSSYLSSQLIVAVTAEGDPTKTWAGPFVVNADGLVGLGNGTSTAGTMTPTTPPAAPQPLPGLGRCAPAGCVAKDLALGIDAHALWATFDLFTSSFSSSPEDGANNGNAAAASRVGALALGLSRAQLRAGAANKRPTTVALSNFPAWTRALTPATTSPRAKHDSRAGGTQYLVAVSGGAGSGAAAAKSAVVASPLVVDDGDASKGTFIAAWSVTGTGTLVDGCKEGSPLASTETTYVTKSAAPVAAFFGGVGGSEAKKETTKKTTDGDASKVSSSSSSSSSTISADAAVARAPRTLGGAADVSSTRRVGSVTLANGATTGTRKLWVALSTPVRVGSGGETGVTADDRAEEKKPTVAETPPVLGASLLAFEIAPNSVEQASTPASENDGQQQRSKPSLVASTTALLALPSASVVAPAAALARGNGTLVGVSFVTVAADLPPSLAYATFTPEAGVSSVRLLSKGVSPLSAFVAPGAAAFPALSSFASSSSVPAPGDPRAAPAPSASSLQRLTTIAQPKQPPLPMPRYSGATTDAEGGWWFAGQITGCESSTGGSGSSVGSAATSAAAKAASLSSAPPCKPVTVYTVARVKAVALE